MSAQYRPPSLSRNQGELRKHFKFSEVRDKQIETKKLNSLTFPVLVVLLSFYTMFTPSIVISNIYSHHDTSQNVLLQFK